MFSAFFDVEGRPECSLY